MGGGFVQHLLQCLSPRFDKVGVKTTNGLFLWGWWDYDAWITVMQRIVEPQEISIPPGNGKFGLLVCF